MQVVSWEYIEIKDEKRQLLLASSLTDGAVLYDLSIPKVVGLGAVVGVVQVSLPPITRCVHVLVNRVRSIHVVICSFIYI